MEELMATIPEAEIVILFYEDDANKVGVKIISLNPNLDLPSLTTNYSGAGKKNKVEFYMENKNILEIEKEMLEVMRRGLRNMRR